MTSSNSVLKRPKKIATFTQEIISLHPRPSSQTQTPELPRRPEQELATSQEPLEQQQPHRPKKPAKPKPLQELDSVTNATGEEFKKGDRIQVSALPGGTAEAEIALLYRDNSGNAWAKYLPTKPQVDWPWQSGCVRAERLVKP